MVVDEWVEVPTQKRTDSGASEWEEVLPSQAKPESTGWKGLLSKALSLHPGLHMSNSLVQEGMKDPVGQIGTAAENAGDALTLGYLPQIVGGAKSLAGGDYTSARDEYISNAKKRSEQFPNASLAGKGLGVAGSLALPSTLASAPTALGRIAKAGAVGGGMGLLANPGDKEGVVNPFQGEERLKNAALGGGVGAGGGLAAEAVGGLPGLLGRTAEDRAERAAGAMVPQMKKLGRKGLQGQVGRTLLDEDIIPVLGTPSRISNRLESKIDGRGKELGGLLSEVEQKTSDPKFLEGLTSEQRYQLDNSKFRGPQEAERLKNQLRANHPRVADEKLQPYFDEIDAWLNNPKNQGALSIAENQADKVGMNKFLKDSDFDNPMQPRTIAKKATLDARRALKEGVEKQADTYARIGGEAGGRVKKTNRILGNLEEAQDIAKNRIAHDSANQSFGLGDKISAGVGGSIAGAPGALAAGGVNKFARTFGNSIAARGTNKLSSLLSDTPELASIVKRNPALLPALMEALKEGPADEPSGLIKQPVIGEGLLGVPRTKQTRSR